MAISKEYSDSVKDDESTTSLLSGSDDTIIPNSDSRSLRSMSRWLWIGITILCLLFTNLFTSYITHRITAHTHRSLAEPPGGVASVFRGLDAPPEPTLINVTLYDHDHSIYRQHANARTDAAWDALMPGEKGLFLIKKEDAAESDIDVNRHAYFESKEDGVEGYPVLVEAVHQMHCLVRVSSMNISACY